ncbi:DUF4402 domain-containing protein [Shewanella sp. 10N.286.54.B9]|uniref:DUF4402 domain-containing protein n=1 Tax=Shewanella sp. 10N.286.54.B9 TaxID=3229719 RepID=UPI0035530DDC
MNKKILLSSLIASSLLLSTQANAADATGTATFNLLQPITVTKTADLELGDIDITVDGTCSFSAAGVAGGDICVAGGATQAVGSFDITGSDGDVNVTIAATNDVAGVTLTPELSSNIVTLSGNAGTVDVGGSLAIVAASAVAGSESISYTVSVNY